MFRSLSSSSISKEGNGSLQGLHFSLSISHLSGNERKDINEIIKRNGGSIVIGFPQNTTHLIAGEKEISECGFRVKGAFSKGCAVVLPSFILASEQSPEKPNEWNHTMLGTRRAKDVARNAEELVFQSFQKAILTLQQVTVAANLVENSLREGIDNIAALSMEIFSRNMPDQELTSEINTKELVNKAFYAMKHRNPNLPAYDYDNRSTSPFSRTSTFGAKARPFTSTLLQKKSNPLAERVEQRKREREEKLQKMEEEKIRREEEKRLKELERQKAAQEREQRLKETLEKLEESRKQAEEERNRRLKELEERQQAIADRLLELDFGETSELDERSEGSVDRKLTWEERTRLERAKEHQEERERQRAARIARGEQAVKDLMAQRRAAGALRRKKKAEQAQKALEEKQQLAAAKELARVEYAERHERKRLMELQKQEKEREKRLKEEAKAKEALKPAKPVIPFDDDRKIFVGKIQFEDLKKLPKKLNPEMESNVKTARIQNLIKIFERFGKIEKTKDHILQQQHCFIIYESKESAQKALAALNSYDERKRISKELKEELISSGVRNAALTVPDCHYYLRPVNSLAKPQKAKKTDKKPQKSGKEEVQVADKAHTKG